MQTASVNLVFGGNADLNLSHGSSFGPNGAEIEQFKSMLSSPGSKQDQVDVNGLLVKVDSQFSKSHADVVKAIKRFEETGSAVDLMVASHQGANKSVMVQLFGSVGKKCADNAEQLYKQQ